VVGDVHSCATELDALLTLAQPSRVILVGDVFNKGPDPDGVWALVREWRAESVLGNHDLLVMDLADQGDFRAPKAAIQWLGKLPLFIKTQGCIVVHGGLNPESGHTTQATAIKVRRWPDDSQDTHPFWWELYTGEHLVIYGHDARRGLVDHRPMTLGLDTGCVYGGALTGYLIEEDRVLSVPAERAYRAI